MVWDHRLRRRLKLRDLDTFLAVAEWGSMAKAANHLAVSQPAVSNAIVDMERTLKVRLFDRTPQGVEPTLYGTALQKWAVAVFDDVRQGVKEIEYLADPTSGEVRVGATDPMIGGLLPAVFDQFSREHPGITCQVTQASGIARLHRELRDRNIDVVLGRLAGSEQPDDIASETLFDDPLLVVAGPKSPWARARKVELSKLLNAPWVLPRSETMSGVYLDKTFRALGAAPPRTAIVCNSVEARTAMLKTGRFLGVLPRSVLRFGVSGVHLKVLPVRLPEQPSALVGLVTLKNRTISPVAQLFAECLRKVVKRVL